MFSYVYKLFVEKYISVKYQNNERFAVPMDEMISRVHDQQERMPDFLGFGIKMVAALFIVHLFFEQLFSAKKDFKKHISGGRESNFLPFRNLIRFHDSLFEVANVEEDLIRNHQPPPIIFAKRKFDFIIIGSGPGGAVAAWKLHEAGFDTCILESGRIYRASEIPVFSYNEMLHKYKHAGITTTLGNANITYVEGATFGGGSEINSGLYHRTPDNVLDYWKKEFGLLDSIPDALEKYFVALEQDLCISYFPNGQIPKASLKLEEGAKKLGWDVQEVPRWYKYDESKAGGAGEMMNMSKTYLNNYCNNGGVVYELTKAIELNRQNESWNVAVITPDGRKKFSAKNVILSAGTINTPQILRRAGISRIAGKRFQMHPTIKVVAVFDKKINEEGMGVPVHQVKEFSPDFSFGCSISSKPYLRLAMLDHPEYVDLVAEKWEYMAIYYSMIVPEGSGSVKNLPFFKNPLVTYHLTNRDKNSLAQGLKKLCELLISAGANNLYPSVKGWPAITNINEINQLPGIIDPANTSLMTVHLFSSCPIGERKDRCVADSYGKVFGHEGLFISDGSMLPSAPGVNPQGTIMAFAHRNIEKIITEA